METNFIHMRKWFDIYETLVGSEENLLKQNPSAEDYRTVLSRMRTVQDLLLKEMVKIAKISNEEIKRFKENDNDYIDMIDREKILLHRELISEESAKNLEFIREWGNNSIHGNKSVYRMNKKDLRRKALLVYKKMYRESYLFTNQFVFRAAEMNKQAAVNNKPQYKQASPVASNNKYAANQLNHQKNIQKNNQKNSATKTQRTIASIMQWFGGK